MEHPQPIGAISQTYNQFGLMEKEGEESRIYLA